LTAKSLISVQKENQELSLRSRKKSEKVTQLKETVAQLTHELDEKKKEAQSTTTKLLISEKKVHTKDLQIGIIKHL
jgi:hypothetical protein